MAAIDRASDERVIHFKSARDVIELSAKDCLTIAENKYLHEVLNQLEMNTAYYSYGNGDIYMGDNADWMGLDPDMTIDLINEFLITELNIELQDLDFPRTLYYDCLFSANFG